MCPCPHLSAGTRFFCEAPIVRHRQMLALRRKILRLYMFFG